MNTPIRVGRAMRSKNKITAARAYINEGFKILLTDGKKPLAKYFPHGVKSATDDLKLIKRAFKKHPDANIGISLDGLTVVDCDGPSGKKLLKELNLPTSAKVFTGRGSHAYFKGELPHGSIKLNQVDILTGDGRYVIAPPSKHASGKEYRWSTITDVFEEFPIALKNLTRKRSRGVSETGVKPKIGGAISVGSRNDTLFKLASYLRFKGCNEGTVRLAIKSVNESECKKPLSNVEVRKLLNSSENYSKSPNDLFELVGDTAVEELEALWYPYIMKHGVTLLAGDPGRGKSMLIAMIISIVTTGGEWPLSKERAEKGKVLLLSAEDSFTRVTLPRLKKYGTNTNNLHIMKKFKALDREYLNHVINYARLHLPKLIVIDTLSAYMGGARDMNRQNEVGEFLATLNEVAEEIGCAIIGLAHLNKQSNDHPIYRVVGSIGFMASVRSALILGVDPERFEKREIIALAHGKTNGTIEGKSIAFEKIGGGRDEVPKTVPLGYIDADAKQICHIHTGPVGRPSDTSQLAKERILELLSKRTMTWKRIANDIIGRNIASEGTLNILRAKMARDSEIVQVGRGPKSKWKIGRSFNPK